MPDTPSERSLANHSSASLDPRAARLNRLRRLSFLLDNAIGIPGTRFRFGLDPIIGLIPGGGDTAGLILSSFIVLEAAKMGASKSLLGQMAWNILLETLVGSVPVAGDVFDAAWKSNVKNIELLENHLHLPHPMRSRNRGFALLLIAGLFVALAGCIVLSVLVLRWLVQTLGS